MTGKDVFRATGNGPVDLVQILLSLLDDAKARWCVIGGLGVNAYADPVISLDLDVVVASDRTDSIAEAARTRGLRVEAHEHSLNLFSSGSDLRVQIRTDPRYQTFLDRAEQRTVLGYPMRVASIEDVLQGKLWASADPARRPSKRHKDLSDILRLVEAHPALEDRIPTALRQELGL